MDPNASPEPKKWQAGLHANDGQAVVPDPHPLHQGPLKFLPVWKVAAFVSQLVDDLAKGKKSKLRRKVRKW